MKYRSVLLSVLLSTLVAGSAAHGQSLEMLSTLGKLGVSPTQAIGGAQALMNVAKGNLDPTEYTQLLGGSSELSQLMQLSDAAGAMGGMMGGGEAAAAAEGTGVSLPSGIDAGSLASLASNASLVEQFTGLGLDAGMITQFAPVLLDVASKAGPDTLGLLTKGLGLL